MSALVPSDNVRFIYGVGASDYVDIRRPIFGYSTTIKMPIDIMELPNGKWKTYDHGEGNDTYDQRECSCDFILTPEQYYAFISAFDNDLVARNKTITIGLDSNGFFPFGPDKGDSGLFSTAISIIEDKGRLLNPHGYYGLKLAMVNAGSFPSYALPTEIGSGPVTIGSVSNLRFPDSFFAPNITRYDSVTITGGNTAHIQGRGSSADSKSTNANLRLNQSKAAALVAYLTTGAGRASSFNFYAGADSVPFGLSSGSGSFTAILTSSIIEIKHERFNDFRIDLNIGKQS